MGEQFDLFAEMVSAPDDKRWIVEARRPKLSPGVTLLVVRTLAGAVVWREVLPPEADPATHVATLASKIESGGWPEADRPRPSSYWSPTLLVVVWLMVLTPLALLAWLRWLSGDASAVAPVLLTSAWATAGLLVAYVFTRSPG